jgi:hypothetical protein
MMKQDKVDSILEATTNMALGLVISMTANALIFPLFGWDITLQENIYMGFIYSSISIARNYIIRRLFNGRSVYQAIKGLSVRFYSVKK